MSVILCTKDNPCGKASRGFLQPGECPRCHIRINRDQLWELAKGVRMSSKKTPIPLAHCIHEGPARPPPDKADVRRRYFLCEAGRGVVTACSCGPVKCPKYQPEDE